MITLNDYLYSGHTVLKILKLYNEDLRKEAEEVHNQVDLLHCDFLSQIIDMLEHNDFLTAQSQKIREFYKYMAVEYPFLAFTFKGRIKSLIRSEEKFNGYIVEFVYDYYMKNKKFPTVEELKQRLNCFRDLIAYRIVLSMPVCHLTDGKKKEEEEEKYIYEIANTLPGFLEKYGFIPEPTGNVMVSSSPLLQEQLKPYYRDYIVHKSEYGYQSLHITFYDQTAKCYTEVQIRTKEMDDYAEIGPANHLGYEKRQETERARRHMIPKGECTFFDQAYERGMLLQQLDLSKLNVNMFGAMNNSLINDGCGLFRGRLILPYEHLSHFQNDLMD